MTPRWVVGVGHAASYAAASAAGAIVVAVWPSKERDIGPPPTPIAEPVEHICLFMQHCDESPVTPEPEPKPVSHHEMAAKGKHESADQRFLKRYAEATNPGLPESQWADNAITLGHQVCSDLAGRGEVAAMDSLTERYDISVAEAEGVIDAAKGSYCPED